MERMPNQTEEKNIDFFSSNFYERLGVDDAVDEDSLKEAYFVACKLALSLDVADGSEEAGNPMRRKMTNEAYLCLKNPETRARYDIKIKNQQSKNTIPQEKTEAEIEVERRKNEAIRDIRANIISGVPNFTGVRDRWIKLGVVTKEEINNLPEMKVAAIERVLYEIRYHGWPNFLRFEIVRDEWIGSGLLTKNEVNNFSEIRKSILGVIRQNLRYDYNGAISGMSHFKKEKGGWIKRGLLSMSEAESIIAEFEN